MSRFRKHLRQAVDENPLPGSVPKGVLQQARKTGQLNLSNREFTEVPDEVWKLNAPPAEGDADFGSSTSERWWDQVELTKLILASNNLAKLSEKISAFSALTVLDLHDNKLSELPEEITSLEVLEKLDVSHNQLKSLPQGVSELDHMTTFLIQHNQLSTLPRDLAHLVNLRTLDASHNQLQMLPSNMSQMTNLQRLNFSNNQLVAIPQDVCSLPLLSFLDLNHNKLSQLPGKWEKLTSLKELYLRNNILANLPDFSNCSNLKELYSARNELSIIDMNKLPVSLVILELRDNKIKELGEDIVRMKELQRLDLANNDISTLPPKLGLMDHVKALNVEGNPMRGLRRDIINKGTLAIIQYLRLRIVDSEVVNGGHTGENTESSLPVSSAMAERTKMHAVASSKSLDLSSKTWSENLIEGCEEIPLELVNMSKMGLSHIPPEISWFKRSLKSLNFSINKLTVLSPEIGGFLSLTHLNLVNNMLTDLPGELGQLKSLLELNIVQNRFTSLPNCIFDMESLEHLLASGNKIEKINIEGLKKLPKLSTLALQNNNISQVPPELGLMTLQNLQLEGNTFKMPRHNILQQGTQAVLDYLKQRVPNT